MRQQNENMRWKMGGGKAKLFFSWNTSMFTRRELCRTYKTEQKNVTPKYECNIFLQRTTHRPVLSEAIWFLYIIQLHVQFIVQRIATITAQDAVTIYKDP